MDINIDWKSRKTKILAALGIAAGIIVLFIASDAGGGPCAKVKAGRVAFKDSPSCVRECAQDGGDCPYAARAMAPDAESK